ncbi:site-specific recombinase [Paramagnetospirillum caucaseum]|uniref:Site-specific recombinase n=1 Tax=Paramagnetospirillum caucaseum TaxID=1244869 RepID=M2ZV17_9PROT|nr:recombinase family protein [Paramagnetospirillum caucaseum]EME71237.1 site-specific recombinase [Paramagnetospirillum caucaseum]
MIVGYFRRIDGDEVAAPMALLRAERCLRIETDPVGRSDSRTLLLDGLDRGDVLVSPSLDHLAVSLSDVVRIARHAHGRGATLRLVLEKVDTSLPAARNVLVALDAFEAAQRSARRRAGVEQAALSGNRPGRPRKLDAATLRRLKAEMEAGRSFAALAQELGIHPTTVMRRLRALEDGDGG